MQSEGQRYHLCLGCKEKFWTLEAYRRHRRAATHPDQGHTIGRGV